MADNTTLNAGSGGDVIAADDIGGVKFQRVKVVHGADGSNDGDVSDANPYPVRIHGYQNDYAPGYKADPVQGSNADYQVDPDGNLMVRGQVLTDEGSYRVNFANSSLAVSVGTVTLTNGSKAFTGTGFDTAELRRYDYIKLDADAESAFAQIESLDSPTSGTLVAAYTGTGGTGAASRAIVKPVTGSGGSIAVASGVCTITSGTTNSASTGIVRGGDWLPTVRQCGVAVSQRIANQTVYITQQEGEGATPKWFVQFVLDGTTNTTVKCQSARNPSSAPSAAETEETTVTLPGGATTATARRYRAEVLSDQVKFFIDGTLVAMHFKSMPGPRDPLVSIIKVVNGTGAGSSTTVTVDYDTLVNHNKVMTGMMSDAEAVDAQQPTAQLTTYNVAGVIAINTVLMTIDCRRIRQLSWHCTSMGTTGVVTPEWSNDPTAATWQACTSFTSAGAAATTFNAAGLWNVPVQAAYFRLRLSTATTAGTTTIALSAMQSATQQPWLATQTVSGTVTAAQGSAPYGILGQTQVVTDVTSAAITATATTTAITPSAPACAEFVVAVTVVSGTSPTMDITVEESADAGTTWKPIYSFSRITAVGVYRSGPVLQTGNRVRYVQTIGGTTPSFTRTVNRLQQPVSPHQQRQIIARASGSTYTWDVNTGATTFATGSNLPMEVSGLPNHQLILDMGAIATTAPQAKIQGSENGTTWYDISTALTAVASSVVQITVTNVPARFVRAVISTAGSGATLNEATLRSFA